MDVSALRRLWPWKQTDPYEDFYLNARPEDPRNLISSRIREAPEGGLFAVRAETHTPAIMAQHIRDLGRFFGADLVRIIDAASLPQGEQTDGLPYTIICGFRAEHDPRDAPGIGGHAAALKGAFATFQISAIIREYGFHATHRSGIDPERAAALAGVGSLDRGGRLKVPGFGTQIYIADLILTDLPVEPG